MPKTGIRPHTWKVQGAIPHAQHVAHSRMKAQADFRGEPWNLTLEEFQQLWGSNWDKRGRATDDLCLTRDDPEGAWEVGNILVMNRKEQLQRKNALLMEKRHGKSSNR